MAQYWKEIIISGSDADLRTVTSSQADIKTGFTASGLIYPDDDGTSTQVIQTDGSGNLSFVDKDSGEKGAQGETGEKDHKVKLERKVHKVRLEKRDHKVRLEKRDHKVKQEKKVHKVRLEKKVHKV